jgi:hypothetical protein
MAMIPDAWRPSLFCLRGGRGVFFVAVGRLRALALGSRGGSIFRRRLAPDSTIITLHHHIQIKMAY